MGDRTEQLLRALEKFIRHVDKLSGEDDPAGNGFHREYRDLREIAINNREIIPAKAGKIPHNIRKNRYKDIVPFDETRVQLSEIPGLDGSDYINANFILDANKREGYVASQGPLPHTLGDFWRMIDELKVKVVLMACKEIESGKKKCAKYWVDKGEEPAAIGHYQISCVAEEALADDCIERHLRLTAPSGVHDVFQYHYTGWPDHGIPDDIDVILAMIKRMRDIRVNDADHAPVVVHCSAGCGRTGTICAIDYAWEILKSGQLTSEFSLFEIVKCMREQRQSMIQTPEQYEMAHLAVKELFQKHIEIMHESDYANVVIKGDNEYSNSEDMDETESTYSEAQSNIKKLQLDALDTIRNYDESPSESGSQGKPDVTPALVQIEDKKTHTKAKKETEKIQKEAKIVLQEKVDTSQPKRGSAPGLSYDNVFTGTNYENVEDKGMESETTQNVTNLRNSFEQKPTVMGPKFVGSGPTTVTAPPAVPRTTISQQSARVSGPLFVSATSHPPSNVPKQHSSNVPTQSGPTFSNPIQSAQPNPIQSAQPNPIQSAQPNPIQSAQPTQIQSAQPNPIQSTQPKKVKPQSSMEGKFVSVISFSGGSSSISQGNGDQYEMAKHVDNNSFQYDMAKNVTPSRNSLQNVKLTNDASAIYAVPGKTNGKLNTNHQPVGAVYSQVTKGSHSDPPSSMECAYESIAPVTQPQMPARSKHYEDVQFDGDYSTVGEVQVKDDGPPLPRREYDDTESNSDTSKSSVADKLKSKITNTLHGHHKSSFHGRSVHAIGQALVQNVSHGKHAIGQAIQHRMQEMGTWSRHKTFNMGTKNTTDNTDPKSNAVPGFNQRLEKKVKGPREMPWNKKTKL